MACTFLSICRLPFFYVLALFTRPDAAHVPYELTPTLTCLSAMWHGHKGDETADRHCEISPRRTPGPTCTTPLSPAGPRRSACATIFASRGPSCALRVHLLSSHLHMRPFPRFRSPTGTRPSATPARSSATRSEIQASHTCLDTGSSSHRRCITVTQRARWKKTMLGSAASAPPIASRLVVLLECLTLFL
jgi:hypothetical protein